MALNKVDETVAFLYTPQEGDRVRLRQLPVDSYGNYNSVSQHWLQKLCSRVGRVTHRQNEFGIVVNWGDDIFQFAFPTKDLELVASDEDQIP